MPVVVNGKEYGPDYHTNEDGPLKEGSVQLTVHLSPSEAGRQVATRAAAAGKKIQMHFSDESGIPVSLAKGSTSVPFEGTKRMTGTKAWGEAVDAIATYGGNGPKVAAKTVLRVRFDEDKQSHVVIAEGLGFKKLSHYFETITISARWRGEPAQSSAGTTCGTGCSALRTDAVVRLAVLPLGGDGEEYYCGEVAEAVGGTVEPDGLGIHYGTDEALYGGQWSAGVQAGYGVSKSSDGEFLQRYQAGDLAESRTFDATNREHATWLEQAESACEAARAATS